ncbi:hypothetical protein J5N97_007708 [Dioscorea zingiberensis]|uniref:VQ domain-containing protein n=1 Tax=Dioscorea zingiberensis TaxID=325984 RepID=A0A9D5DFV6_9LILI|nr:hypothetical protein J5N97_007708 [Dioscorea zingiberensis]
MPSKRARSLVPVKVKVIVTRFVQTDAMQFKSVVQNLTGKDSKAAEETVAPPPPERPMPVRGGKRQVVAEELVVGHEEGNGWIGDMLMKPNFVLEEFENGSFLEPSLEKMYEMWSCFA